MPRPWPWPMRSSDRGGERDAALKTQAELNDALLAQRDLMAEVAALKDRLAASEQRAAVAEAKIEVMTQMKDE